MNSLQNDPNGYCVHTPSSKTNTFAIFGDFIFNRKQLINKDNITSSCFNCGVHLFVPGEYFSAVKKTILMLVCFFASVCSIWGCSLIGVKNRLFVAIACLFIAYSFSFMIELVIDSAIFVFYPWRSAKSAIEKDSLYQSEVSRYDCYQEMLRASKNQGFFLGIMVFLDVVEFSFFAGFFLLMSLIAISIRQQKNLVIHVASILVCGVLLILCALYVHESNRFIKIVYFIIYVVMDIVVYQSIKR